MDRCCVACLVLLVFACAAAAAERPATLATNGGFEKGTTGWNAPSNCARIAPAPGGGSCIEVTGPGGITQDLYVGARPRTFTVAVDVKAEGVEATGPGGHAYAAVYQLGLQGDLKAYKDFVPIRGSSDWKRETCTFDLAPGAEIVSLRCGVWNAKGTAWFDNWTLVEGKQPFRLDEVAEPRPQTSSEKGIVGIFRQEGFPAKGAPSSPDALAEAIKAEGAEVKFLTIAEMSDPALLKPSNFDIIVLPYGESFPGAARDSFVQYLHAGGDFISMGGYAFNNLLHLDDGKWVTEKERLALRLAEALKPERSLLPDGGFEKEETANAPVGGQEADGKWRRSSASCAVVPDAPAEGKSCAKVEVPSGGKGSESRWDLRLPARHGCEYRVSASIKTKDVVPVGTGYAYLALYQYGPEGKLLKSKDFAHVTGSTDWTRYDHDFTPEAGVTVLYIKCGLYQASGTAWFDGFHLADVSGLQARPMNTSTGKAGDGLGINPMQIGAFDADYRLKRVVSVKTAPGQRIFPDGIAFGPVKGWAASGVRGYDQTRWIPLLMAYDRYGRERGSAGSLLIHYDGFFNGSAWAYFGAEDTDLFAAQNTQTASAVQELVRFMVRGVYLRNLRAEMNGYPPGSPVNLEATVENRGAKPQAATVRFCVRQEGQDAPFFEAKREVAAESNAVAIAKADFILPPTASGLCEVKAELTVDGKPADGMESAFVALAPLAKMDGPPLQFRENYFRYGERPIFLFGSDNYSNVYKSATEGPLWWAREHAASRDFGFEIYENLQYSNSGHRMEEPDWRSFLAMSQLTQQYGLVFMPCLLVGHNVAVSDEEIAEESRQCLEYSQRLKDTPKLLWYINGDYQLRHNDLVALKKKWADFLQSKYGAQVGDLAFPPKNTGRWDDPRQIDLHLFHVKLMTDWNRAHVAAIRQEDKAHPITSEYYQRPFWGIDLRLTIDGQDVSNIGYFDKPVEDITCLPLKIRWNDMRAQGKSMGLGEYGVKTHPAWSLDNGAQGYHIVRTEEEEKQLFMAVAHYGFGLGGSKVQNWCLRDGDQWVFPWGVFYPGPFVPKDVAFTHRNLSLLLRMFSPQYDAPALTVLLCDNMRLGNFPQLGTDAGYRAFGALLGLHADFNVMSDWYVKEIPLSTKVIIYPAALCPGDESFEGLVRWVEASGKLLVTGDFGYNSDRTHTRPDRLKRLAGVEWVATNYPPEERAKQTPGKLGASPGPQSAAPMMRVQPAGAQILATTESGDPALARHSLGKGTVYLFADPMELALPEEEPRLRELYSWFLKEAGISRATPEPDEPTMHVMTVRTRTGAAHVAFNYREGSDSQTVAIPTKAGRISLTAKDRYPAIAGVSDDGRVQVLGGFKSGKIADEEILSADGMATAIALDGADLRSSEAVMLLPFSDGRVELRSTARAWRNPVVLLGDLNGGRFRALETLRPAPGKAVAMDFDADRATLFALVCEADAAAKWQDFTTVLVSNPERFPGY